MKIRRILIIDGHPDASAAHYVHALADAYEGGAKRGGHEVKRIDVARLDFAVLRSAVEWQEGEPDARVRAVQEALAWSEHMVILFPLWLGDMPARLKAFFEQVLRPGFAIGEAQPGRLPKKLLAGRSARIIVTMGMPAFFYRLYYRAHSVKSLARNVLQFCGIRPVRVTYIGMVEGKREARTNWLAKVALLGAAAR